MVSGQFFIISLLCSYPAWQAQFISHHISRWETYTDGWRRSWSSQTLQTETGYKWQSRVYLILHVMYYHRPTEDSYPHLSRPNPLGTWCESTGKPLIFQTAALPYLNYWNSTLWKVKPLSSGFKKRRTGGFWGDRQCVGVGSNSVKCYENEFKAQVCIRVTCIWHPNSLNGGWFSFHFLIELSRCWKTWFHSDHWTERWKKKWKCLKWNM